ncbi:hypothetical protein MBVG596_0107 [Mycoplasmopsis bovigenitalium]|uniref:hypothetical protein n=1 Tax=Mycoplasmopsis bovigenitalium TaxID=2112 RepID=UPI00090AF5E4|nr:hypothetical protein [Mycoplasmopsis bovigenitalium]BAW18038.1 hypothetical protein MBVG596_0107 [Mycoplasmopsis bovigenitalium]
MKLTHKLIIATTPISLPIIASSCSNQDDQIYHIQLELNELGKTMHNIEIFNKVNELLDNGKNSNQIIQYLNQFFVNSINSEFDFVSINTLNNDQLELKLKSKKNNNRTFIISGLEKYIEKSPEKGKITDPFVKVGDIEISTTVAENGKRISAIEFSNIFAKKYRELNSSTQMLFDWLISNKYITITGDYKQSNWDYFFKDTSHADGSNEFHAYISAIDKQTGKVFRSFNDKGEPGFSIFGWNQIIIAQDIHILRNSNVNKEGENITANQFINELNSINTIKQKLNVISKYTDQKFAEFAEKSIENVDYDINAKLLENNKVSLTIKFKGKSASSYAKQNTFEAYISGFKIHNDF